jgi:hypothetical protein
LEKLTRGFFLWSFDLCSLVNAGDSGLLVSEDLTLISLTLIIYGVEGLGDGGGDLPRPEPSVAKNVELVFLELQAFGST